MSSAGRSYGYSIPPTGYRLPEDVSLGEVRLQVADLERSLSYYQTVIGLRVINHEETRAALGAFGSDKVIIELNEKKGVAPIPRRGRLGLYHFAILLPDRGALGRFLRHLAEVGEYAGMSDHLVSEALYLTDPDGLGIEVYADRPRSSWNLSGTNLSMGSVHLDTEDLIRAAGAEPWTGAPAGTKIGHVHLYVSDLETAEKFYHEAVGFDKIRLEFPGALFMSAGGYHHHLGTNTWSATSPQATDSDARLLEWTVEISSADALDKLRESLTKSGFAAASDANSVTTVDPWTTRVRFRAP
jgi:catechol 2,3-dioxygenase